MATIKRTAIAEFILRNDGGAERRVQPGEEVELTAGQFERFATAGCVFRDDELNAEAAAAAKAKTAAATVIAAASLVDPAAIARQQINADKLFESTVPQLREIARTEKIDLGTASKKDEIVAAIRAHRAGTPGQPAAGDPDAAGAQRTEEEEAARRAADAEAAARAAAQA